MLLFLGIKIRTFGARIEVLLESSIEAPEPIPYVEPGPGTLILEGLYGEEIAVDVIFGSVDEPDGVSESRYDLSLLIGVGVMSLCAGGLIVGLLVYRLMKK